jgi:hypothetical protein
MSWGAFLTWSQSYKTFLDKNHSFFHVSQTVQFLDTIFPIALKWSSLQKRVKTLYIFRFCIESISLLMKQNNFVFKNVLA